MVKKTKKHASIDTDEGVNGISPRTRAVVLAFMIAIGIGAIALAVTAIVLLPKANPGAQRGVGATGFTAFTEENGDLGMGKVVSKEDVASVLGNKSKVVSNVSVSKVFNIDGSRGQTASYDFVRSDGVKATTYVDVMVFKNQATLDAANVTKNTAKGGTVNNHPVYFMHAQTLGSDREYRLMIVKGLKVYKFVVVQPLRNITISEVAALAAMKKLAAKAEL